MTTRRGFLAASIAASRIPQLEAAADDLARQFGNPPDAARPWTYWGWSNGYAEKRIIIEDFEDMNRRGIGGVLLMHGGGPKPVPGPNDRPYMSAEWVDLFHFAAGEARRRGIVLCLNICSGWNAGGPWIPAEMAGQALLFRKLRITGPDNVSRELPEPVHNATSRWLPVACTTVCSRSTASSISRDRSTLPTV